MPSGCCHGSTCSCVISATGRISVDGSGQPNDPFVLDMEADFASVSNISFNTIADGSGTAADPWTIETQYASSSKLDHIPDVNAPTPANGQVLSWDTATARWIPRAPTTAPTGAVLHNTSLSGDGSAGNPLAVVPSTARLIGSFPAGIGLSDDGMSSVVQHFTDDADRTATLPTPTINTLSMLDSEPGILNYWTGTVWSLLPNQTTWVASGGELLQLSGGYTDGLSATVMIVQISTTTDTNGVFDVLTTLDLTGMSGVLAVNLQETGSLGWKAVVYPESNRIQAKAFWLTDGSPMSGSPVTATVQAILY
jgi:hypothetical protein